MTGLSAQVLLKTWETARDQPLVLQGLTLLVAGFPDIASEEFSRLSLGQRDAWLLTMRERLFGAQLECVAECPQCRERSEFTLSTQELLAQAPAGDPEDDYTILADGHRLRFRLPDSYDLDAASHCGDDVEARNLLLSRLVLEVERGSQAIAPTDMSEPALEALEQRIVQCDPLLEILIDLRCPACEHAWRPQLDVLSAVLMEVSSHARRILREVHTLAHHYHWSESDVLALSSVRRQAYLELVAE